MADFPSWLLNLVNAVGVYEDCHGHPDDNWTCLSVPFEAVPDEVRAMARGYGQAKREGTDGL